MNERNGVWGDVVKGAVAGAAATWLMNQVTTYLYEHEDEGARRREQRARGGKTAYGVVAEKAAALVRKPISDEQRRKAGEAIHWTMGIGAGVGYALLRRRYRAVELGRGLAFGTAFFLVVDELANAALGLTPGPRAFPWQAHGRGLAGHLVLGATTDAGLRVLDRVA